MDEALQRCRLAERVVNGSQSGRRIETQKRTGCLHSAW